MAYYTIKIVYNYRILNYNVLILEKSFKILLIINISIIT